MARTQTVTFNVGGEKFQVARSLLLDFYPNSMLAKAISERWQTEQDPDEEIFLDRCPKLFRQVLEYLRNKKVDLPITVAKKAVLSELKYYCVDDVDEEAIDDSLTRGVQLAKGMEDTKKFLFALDEEVDALHVLKLSIKKFKDEMDPHWSHDEIKEMVGTRVLDQDQLFKYNECLKKAGLKLNHYASCKEYHIERIYE